MIKVQFFHNSNGCIYRFRVCNHGEAVVCAGVSALVITCVNFIQERLAADVIQSYADEDFIDFEIPDIKIGISRHDASLIIENMAYGIRQIQESYPNEIRIENYKMEAKS